MRTWTTEQQEAYEALMELFESWGGGFKWRHRSIVGPVLRDGGGSK